MSDGPRFPVDVARKIADRLMALWGMGVGCMMGGSIRRGCPDVGDIELIAPLPEGGTAGAPRDWLYDRMCEGIAPPEEGAGLFGGLATGRIGAAKSGFKPFFKHASIEIAMDAVGAGPGVIKLDLWRYTPGHSGNRGWTELVRTGAGDFGKGVLAYWKYLNGIGPEKQGSIEGFLVNSEGWPVATPTEPGVFRMMNLVWVPPALRTSEDALCSPEWRGKPEGGWQRRKLLAGMKHLGIGSVTELEARFAASPPPST